MNHTKDSIRSLAEAYTSAWCSQEPERVAAYYDENGSLVINDGAPAVGRAAIAGVARGFMSDFPDMQVLMDELVFDGGEVRYNWTLIGTNTGPGGTGRAVRISGFEAWQISEGGLILRSQGHFDSKEYRRQLGL